MRPDRLDSLLQQHLWEGPREPVSPDCLGIHTILRLLDRPEDTQPRELEHLATCRACQRAVALVRRDRETLEASWPDEAADETEDSDRAATTAETEPVRPRTIKLSGWLTRSRAVTGIAAVLVIAVGVGWWLTQGRSTEVALLGPISGQFVLDPATRSRDITRSGEQQERKYAVSVELNAPAYITFLYLDHTRKLKLPSNAMQQADKPYPAGLHSNVFSATVTHDPPGRQWIAAIASDKPFDPSRLRDELQSVIEALPNGTPMEGPIGALERALDNMRPEFSFRGHRFDVPASNTP